ncbi:MAG: fumarylacetoacetate hydrolase family protein [Verrucomicrobiales bacterium]
MKLCRFENEQSEVKVGLLCNETTLIDLSAAGIDKLSALFERDHFEQQLAELAAKCKKQVELSTVRLLSPAEKQEVWAAGVTYLRSKKARMDESEFSASAYDRVYEAPRPELFFKSLPEKVVPHNAPVGIRKDSKWNVPEPELALVLNSKGKLVGFTIGNDMSSRDIEGENALYLPQAKIYQRSCALGPFVTVGSSEAEARSWLITLQISRAGKEIFQGQTSVSQIKRTFSELIEYLFRSQVFPSGAVLLTGTGVVPSDDFTLAAGDNISINISGIGTLSNPVTVV